MPDLELDSLRTLRRRADSLIQTLVSDLRPFRHDSPRNGFLRTPESESIPDDVNVTTTCSCLMALALTGTLNEFYKDDPPSIASDIFGNVLGAPWMSSGLAENNAFTTTLVLRTLGFLTSNGTIPTTITSRGGAKRWEPQLHIKNLRALAKKLTAKKKDPLSELLFSLMPNSVQMSLTRFVSSGTDTERTKRQLTAELSRIIRTTALYEKSRFKGVRLSDATRASLTRPSSAYSTAQLNRLLLDDFYSAEIASIKPRSLRYIVRAISADPARFAINDYASSAAVIYWYVDGISRANIDLPEANWRALCEWATAEFGRQRSLVVARHAAMMDPIAMAMSACLCARLRSISNRGALSMSSAHRALLPSLNELEQSIIELFGEQTESGIWPKYFPLFHYQEAGSNFCFTFELLEAILTEFGHKDNRLLAHTCFVNGLDLALTWCERNRLQYSTPKRADGDRFAGWNSGGFVDSLRKGQPESWATAVVHMFLWELVDVLSKNIQYRLLDKYVAKVPTPKWPKLKSLLDIELWMGQHKSLADVLSNTIVESSRKATGGAPRQRRQIKGQLSALLFGPPGTSKTQVAKAVANELGWPLVEIDPSHFLQGSFQNIYVQAEKVFEDVTDLARVVVLFDEMDALVQKRDAEQVAIDTESKFLTTYMLPKLATLHDRRQLVFLMATNFQENFDDAIKRTGRFDLLLCMGPPTLKAKCEAIHVFYGEEEKATPQTQKAGANIWAVCEKDRWLQQQLGLYTFGEFKSLITGIADKTRIAAELHRLGAKGLLALVKKDSATVGLRFDDVEPIIKQHKVETISDLDGIDIEFSPESLKKRAVRYLRDRKESKMQ